MKKLLLSIAILFVLTNCQKSSLRGDHFIFGTSFGECQGDCIHFFMLKKGELYSDNMTSLDKLKFKNSKLSQDKVELAKKIENELPDLLNNSGSATFGCPDCRDQGAIHLEIKKNNKTVKFLIDTDTSEIPKEIRKYISDIQLTIPKL